MAAPRVQTSQPPLAVSQLCDHCHQKPKFGTHGYCSKTCASQAATLCNQCHKKQKFQNFEFCGKHCASIAASTTTTTNKPSRPITNNNSGKKASTSGSNQPAAGGIDPMQIAQLVVQHVPQIQALLNHTQCPGSSTSTTASAQTQAIPSTNSAQNTQSTKGTRLIPSFLRAKKNAKPQLNVSTSDNTRCIIAGCKQLAHVDEEGVISEFCSLRHREEAVTSGLRSPCIMCLVLPQSDMDYFCSLSCREESMTKQWDEVEESLIESED